MKILERYIWKTLVVNILVTWLALITLDSFFNYLKEINNIDENSVYGNLQALIYIGYLLPNSMYALFPTATIIGALMGLGQLSASSEIIAMRAAGVSLKNIMFSTLKLGLVLTLFIFFFGEEIATKAKLQGESFKVERKEVGQARTRAGIWVKEKGQIVHIDKAWSHKEFEGISIYQIDKKESRISKIVKAKRAIKQGENWQLQEVNVTVYSKNNIEITQHDVLSIAVPISPNLMEITSIKATQLSVQELSNYIKHQSDNDLSTVQLKQAYWQRFSLPLSTLVMLIIAMPFVFGSQRSGGAGQRIFIGIVLGITFFLVNKASGNIGIVYGLSPISSTFSPLLLFLSLGLIMLKRIR